MQVIIIGAGTTGLLLAQGLKQASIPATVYERETPDYYHGRPREWGMSLHWGTDAINKVLPEHLKARIREIWCDEHHVWPEGEIPTLPQVAGHSGELLMKLPLPNGMRVSRRKMRKLFSEGIDVEYGKILTRIIDNGDSVSVDFQDGSKVTGQLVVGCDGAKSAVREALVGIEKAQNKYLPLSMVNLATKFDLETAKLIRSYHPIWQIGWHKENWMFWLSALDIRDPADPESWVFQFMFSWRAPPGPSRNDLPTQEDRIDFLKSKAPLFAEPYRTALNNLPTDAKFGIDRLGTWEPFDWSDMPLASRVTLAGDAAHSMSPFRGQGLNNALEDAALLKEQLVNAERTAAGWSRAIRQYEVEMIPRAIREVAVSNIAAEMAHNYEAFLTGPLAQFGVRQATDSDLQKQKSNAGQS